MVTALVVGARGFGRHYAKILSTFGDNPAIHFIDTVVLTQTSLEGAQTQARILQELGPFPNMIGVKVSGKDMLAEVLDRYTPSFVGIAARDRQIGDHIHVEYSRLALRYAQVLCEKPFSPTCGDGASVEAVQSLLGISTLHSFGLELPFGVVAQNLLTSTEFRQRFQQATNIKVCWPTKSFGAESLDDVLPHPWSLLSPGYDLFPFEIISSENGINLSLCLQNLVTGQQIPGEIIMNNQQERSLQIDTSIFLFQYNNSGVEVYEKGIERPLLYTSNPLAQQITASLQGKPFFGVGKTYDLQSFLEKVKVLYR